MTPDPVSNENEVEEASDVLADYDVQPPREDPILRYAFPGKRYTVFGHENVELVVVDYRPDAGPAAIDGVVILENTAGDSLPNEWERDDAGVTRDVLAPHAPDQQDRAVYSVNLLLRCLRELTIGEVDPGRYGDLYYEHTTS